MNPGTGEGADLATQAEELAQGIMIRLEALSRVNDHDGASYEQYRTAAIIHSAGTISVGKLGCLLRSAQSTTSEMVSRMTRARLVSKLRNTHDGRVVMVELTDQGRQLVRRRSKKVREAYQVLFGKLSPVEQGAFTAALRQLNEILAKEGE
jgi:DNA-binding MarR family transcriptional regulator